MKLPSLTVAAMMLLWPASACIAQDQSLGDVARESRARAQSAKPAKVLNDDGDRPAITASDDPTTVINKAVAAMLHDTSHRCQKVITCSAPGSITSSR